jgi:hypothetical protein
VTVTAAAAGTWQLDDLTVNRLGFGAMRLTGGAVFGRSVRAAPLPMGRRGPRMVELLKNLPGQGLTPSSRPAYG